MKNEVPLLERLAEIQSTLRIKDVEMARRLGVHRAYWSLVKSGQREMGRKMLRRVLLQWPELREEVLAYIEADEPDKAAQPAVA